ncbi:MAG: hypothetical protein ACRD0J_08710, partial [Acidimicrobiales bacterium]
MNQDNPPRDEHGDRPEGPIGSDGGVSSWAAPGHQPSEEASAAGEPQGTPEAPEPADTGQLPRTAGDASPTAGTPDTGQLPRTAGGGHDAPAGPAGAEPPWPPVLT